jgi:hypothetical protein
MKTDVLLRNKKSTIKFSLEAVLIHVVEVKYINCFFKRILHIWLCNISEI